MRGSGAKSSLIILKRVLSLVILLFAVSYVCFAMVHFSKGSVVYAKSPQGVSDLIKAQIESNLNLDKPLNTQYFAWVKRVVQGDLSHSLISGESVSAIIAERLGETLILGGVSLVLIFILSLLLALVSVRFRGRFIDKIINFISISFFAMPSFAICLLLILFFSVYLGILPSSGSADIGFEGDLLNRATHLILPVSALVLAHLGVFTRIFRTILLDCLNQSFVESARARGLNEWRIYFHLVLKSAFAPMIAYFCANCVAFLMNIYVVESVFVCGGIGSLAIRGIIFKDYPVVLAVVLLSVVAVVALNTIAELIANALDRRNAYV
ncbi:ABC transporter permease [Helicobacter sp. 23-1045]